MKHYIKTKFKDCLPMDMWITKLEMRAFGWVYKGLKTEYTDIYDVVVESWDERTQTGKGSVTQRKNLYIAFKRVSPYSFNLVFNFFEILMSIQSWIRRKLIFLFFGITVLSIPICLLQKNYEALGYLIPIWSLVYCPSIFYMIMGFLLRKICRLDKKMRKRLEKNGYAAEQNL